jgi:hypothetical protein
MIAARITGNTAMTNRATNVTEASSGYVACIFTDTANEADSVAVRIRTVPGGVTASTLRGAATFFERGEPVQPFQPFPVSVLGDSALGEATLGVAFIVFSHHNLLVYVGAGSATVAASALHTGLEGLARQIAAAL